MGTSGWRTPARAAAVLMAAVAAAGIQGGARLDAETVHVAKTGDDAHDGLSWQTSKLTVQAGLNAAAPGEQVWVAAGTYLENVTLKTGVALYGGFAGGETDLSQRNWSTHVTVLDGNQAGCVVMVPGSATSSTRIDGFVIRNGTAYQSDVGWFGGGIYCYLASPTIANNTFTLNTADDGGGGIYCEESSAVITDNTFTGNSSACGGGICCYIATPTIARNMVVGNAAGYGGGIYCESSSATISGNIVARNSADYGYGGGIYCDYYSSPPIVNNMVTGNSAASGYGAGIFCDWYSSPIIVNNVLAGNIADNGLGGGIYLEWYASPTIANNTITANSAYLGGAVYCYYAAPVIANTIVAYNSSGICRAGGDSPSLRYNCVFGNISYDYSGLADPTGADGNIAAQPKFVRQAGPGMDGLWATADDDYGDLHLLPGSRCIDAGGNAEVPPDAADLNGNGNTAELTPIDLAAGPRFANDPAAPDTGSGSAPIVDIGAYEYHPGDATGDGHVDASDLLVLAAAWGRLAGDPIYDPRCDMNVDNAVDVSDLLILAFNWGA